MSTLVLVSDTHGYHRSIHVPPGDILVHAGDWTKKDIGRKEARDFLDWLSNLPHSYKIFIAGNHDGAPEKFPGPFREMVKATTGNVIYLEDEGATVGGLKFWGSPVTPEFFNWHFNRARGEAIRAHWDKIPNDTDVLITHGPPYGFGDWSNHERTHAGCKDLWDAVNRVKPRLHVCGHFHEGHGCRTITYEDGKTTQFVNASICNSRYYPAQPAHVLEINPR